MTSNWIGPDWFEPRRPEPFECSIGLLLEGRAAKAPDEPFAVLEDGETLSNRTVCDAARAMAAQLKRHRVEEGDMVAVWLPNGRVMLAAIFACSMVGAVAVQINIAFRGRMLEHALRISGAGVLVAHAELVERLEGIDTGSLQQVLTAGGTPDGKGLRIEPLDPHEPLLPASELATRQPWDLAAIIFTSGTTGPSKGVRVTCCQLWTLGNAYYGFMSPEDRMLLMGPLFHIGSLGALWGAMATGASVAVMETFNAPEFWNIVRRTGATSTMGVFSSFTDLLMKAPARPDDRDHTFRRSLVSSLNPSLRAFSERFGVELFAGFSMSETSAVTISQVNPSKNNSVGCVRKGLQVRLVDAHDIEVPLGQTGELVVRSELPWVLNDGYQNNPEGTVAAWRNGWFHTGDLMYADADGDLFYVDRLKDAIRRRGENISSAEVEAEVRAFPPVRDAAAVGVTAEGDSEDVLVAVCACDGLAIDPAELLEFLQPRMPHYMIPRYVRVLPELPLTLTNKVQKSELRAQGVTHDTWDREAAGIRIRRQRLSSE